MSDLPRLPFFPALVENKIVISQFLSGCEGLAQLVDELGAVWKPLSYDMYQNIRKVADGNAKRQCQYVEDLLLEEEVEKQFSVAEGLVWLKRAIQLLHIFLKNIVEDENSNENLELVLDMAYQQALAPYHNWLTRKMFGFFRRACPSRTETLKLLSERKQDLGDDILFNLGKYCTPLEITISHLDQFYAQHFPNFSAS